MRNYFIFFFLIISIILWSEEFNFRGITENSTVDEIMLQEGLADNVFKREELNLISEVMLAYHNREVAGYDTQMLIEIANKGIYSGTYLFKIDNEKTKSRIYNPLKFVTAYYDLKEKLIKIYGSKGIFKEVNPEKLNKDISELQIKTISNASPYITKWEVGEGQIWLVLSEDDFGKWKLYTTYLFPQAIIIMDVKNHNKHGL